MISLVDYEIGRLLDFLNKKGISDNTLVVFTSDHGDYMGEHGLVTKSPALYDCLVRIPMIFRWPEQIDSDRRDNRFASAVDLLPTLVSAAGLEYPDQVEGINLLPYLTDHGKKGEIREVAYSEYGIPGEPYNQFRLKEEGISKKVFVNPYTDKLPWEANPVALAGRIRMVRNHKWKYIEEEGGTCELYDLVNDPHELVNLWDEPVFQDIQEKLFLKLDLWKKQLNK